MTWPIIIHPAYESAIRWTRRGSCGNPGCTDPECCCAFCGLPIGVADEDSRWDQHPQDCGDCDLCRDIVPLMLFRGKGKAMEQASFHSYCFGKIAHFRTGIQTDPVGSSA